MPFNLPRNDKNLRYARQLRKNMTREERKLWYNFLKNHPLKWYKQKPIGDYIVDFYCAKVGLVIELDGNQHAEVKNREYDESRTKYLNSLKITVLRFSNYDIDRNFSGVCQSINEKIADVLSLKRMSIDC